MLGAELTEGLDVQTLRSMPLQTARRSGCIGIPTFSTLGHRSAASLPCVREQVAEGRGPMNRDWPALRRLCPGDQEQEASRTLERMKTRMGIEQGGGIH
jgi:hypothetical protein